MRINYIKKNNLGQYSFYHIPEEAALIGLENEDNFVLLKKSEISEVDRQEAILMYENQQVANQVKQAWEFWDKEAEKQVYSASLDDCLKEYANLYCLDFEQEVLPGCLIYRIKFECEEKGISEDKLMRIKRLGSISNAAKNS